MSSSLTQNRILSKFLFELVVYLLAEVKSVHFLADAPYYTVVRLDNQEEMRADVGE
jgi:hypothetical protein